MSHTVQLIGTHYEPCWEDGAPFCSTACRQHDGKRCKELGASPFALCLPAIRDVTTQLQAYQGQEQHKCHNCGVLPNEESHEDEQCSVCGKGNDR